MFVISRLAPSRLAISSANDSSAKLSNTGFMVEAIMSDVTSNVPFSLSANLPAQNWSACMNDSPNSRDSDLLFARS
jgi:hypothetical protein